MQVETDRLLTFHLTGEKPKSAPHAEQINLWPALLSGYRDLTQIRYDYPLVLSHQATDPPVISLTDIINGILRRIAPPGIKGEKLRKNLLRLEKEMRTLISPKKHASLSDLWNTATKHLLAQPGLSNKPKAELKESLESGRRALQHDGTVIICDEQTPARLITHAWSTLQQKNNQSVLAEIREIVIKLSDILANDYVKSNASREPEALKAAVGTSFEDEIDFVAMAKPLPKVKAKDLLPEKRRRRIEFALSIIWGQKFFSVDQKNDAYSFIFRNCTEALHEFKSRLPKMVDFVKAVRLAELEIENKYREEKHDKFFRQFDAKTLTPEDIGIFPSYLVCMHEKNYDQTNKVDLIEILSSELPIKVLFQTGDVFKQTSAGNGSGSFSGWNLGLANMAMSLNNPFVLQTTSSNLYQVAEDISDGLKYKGPALFSLFSTGAAPYTELPPYLFSASALQSRAFPTFVFNPEEGSDWASRFQVNHNPQPEQIWPVNDFSYQDEDVQLISEEIPFTLIDFLATDRRFADDFMPVPKNEWGPQMVPLRQYLQLDETAKPGKVPYIMMVGGENTLHRVVVKKGLLDHAKRYAKAWRNLQELGGIENSHAQRLLNEKQKAWEEAKEKEIDELKRQLQTVTTPAAAETTTASSEKPEVELEPVVEERSPDEAYIETPRCSTCNECTNKNNKMFAYNENKQAYIADLQAGTYREMVEAAEACQVAVIHPGKPWNPAEPNLEELMARAAKFK